MLKDTHVSEYILEKGASKHKSLRHKNSKEDVSMQLGHIY